VIGAEIVALVALLLGGAFGFRFLATSAKSRQKKREHDEIEHERMHKEMREALETGRHEPIDSFLVLWGSSLTKTEREQLEKIREDRYVSEDMAKAKAMN
jgi:hypothetical protein